MKFVKFSGFKEALNFHLRLLFVFTINKTSRENTAMSRIYDCSLVIWVKNTLNQRKTALVEELKNLHIKKDFLDWHYFSSKKIISEEM